MTYYLMMLLIGYVVGAIPVGVIVALMSGIGDITKKGSGNIGATNVARFLGVRFFVLVFFLDSCKAFLFMKAFEAIVRPEPIQIGIAWLIVLLGNSYSIFLRFKGGKGVSTFIGLLAASYVSALPYVMGAWLVVLALTRVVGVASVVAVGVVPGVLWYFDAPLALLGCASLGAIWIWWRHYENIKKFFSFSHESHIH